MSCYCWCALQCDIYSSWIAFWLFLYIVWMTHGELFYLRIVESNVCGRTFGQELLTFTMTYYTAWRKMDPLTSRIICISSVLSTPSSQDSRLICSSYRDTGLPYPKPAVGARDAAAPHPRARGRCGSWVIMPMTLLSAFKWFFSIYILIILSSFGFRESKLRILIGRAQGSLITLPTQVLQCQKLNVHWRQRTLKLYALPLIPFLIQIISEDIYLFTLAHALYLYSPSLTVMSEPIRGLKGF